MDYYPFLLPHEKQDSRHISLCGNFRFVIWLRCLTTDVWVSQQTLVIANYVEVQDLQSSVDLQNNAERLGFVFFPPQILLLRDILSMVEAKTTHTILTFPMQIKQLRPNPTQYYWPTAALPGFFNRQLSLLPAIPVQFVTLLLQCLDLSFTVYLQCLSFRWGYYYYWKLQAIYYTFALGSISFSVKWKRFYVMLLFTQF